MKLINIKAEFKEFFLQDGTRYNSCLSIPAVRSTSYLKYGIHSYYFINLKLNKGCCVTIGHKEIIQQGFNKICRTFSKAQGHLPKWKLLFSRYHYGFNLAEEIMLMTIPHTITCINESRYFINLWAYTGYIDVDLHNHSVKYIVPEGMDNSHVLGSRQFYDKENDELYFASFSLEASFMRIAGPEIPVPSKIYKQNLKTGQTRIIWSGDLTDYLHDILLSKTGRYCIVCELGMYKNMNDDLIPSKVLILDLYENKSWVLSRFIVAAHAQFDPEESDIVYFSNHNFNFSHGGLLKVLKNASFLINFRGPAAVYKYRLTKEGPKELGFFTRPDFFRLTNFHVFRHRDKKLLAAIGAPNFIFIADGNSMEFLEKYEIKPRGNVPLIVGTFSPSLDGERLFIQTNRTLTVLEIASGKQETLLEHECHHTCANHMITVQDMNW